MGSNSAITEIIGVMLLIGISVSLFAVVYYSILSTDLQEDAPSLFILSSIDEQGDIIIHHQGGETVDGEDNIQLEIAGIRQPMTKLKPYILNDFNNDEDWNFGETIAYPLDNVSNLEIKLNIIDKQSNSLLLSSVLQDGYAVSLFGLGGIWHFNEGSGTTAYDSSGNLNHGKIYGTDWINGINGTGLEFNPYTEDHVLVHDRISLDISSDLTIEAWFKSYNPNSIIGSANFDGSFGHCSQMTHVKSNIYAIVYLNQPPSSTPNCILKTMYINSIGSLDNISVDEIEVEPNCREPTILKINNDYIAVAYGDDLYRCHVKTYHINETGHISYTNNETIYGTDCQEISFTHVNGDVYSIVYGDNNKGFFYTFNITEYGEIGTIISSVTFNQQCEDPELIYFQNGLFLLASIGNPYDSIKSFTIDEWGNINETGNLVEISNGGDDPDLCKISDETIAVAFENDKKKGVIKTYNIQEDGDIVDTGQLVIFENDECQNPYIIHLYKNIYMVGYEGGGGHKGYLAQIKIPPDGTIEDILTVTPYVDRGLEPNILQISDYIFLISYADQSPQPGGIISFCYVPQVLDPSYAAGIFKNNSFGIYANYTAAFGYLNNKTISFMGINPGWVHLVMVYDQSQIKLYVNASEVASIPYTEKINVNDYDLVFGEACVGIIDEIAIYGKALTPDEIYVHYMNPGNYH